MHTATHPTQPTQPRYTRALMAVLMPMQRETPRTLTREKFLGYLLRDEPFVLSDGAAINWRSVRLWTEEYLTERVRFPVGVGGLVDGENETVCARSG